MDKTIAAISTPVGIGGIAVIRVSGEDAVAIADKVYRGKSRLKDVGSHTIHYGYIVDQNDEKIDEVLVSVMLAPKTFTRENVVEISTHGGIAVSRRVMDALIKAGARHAEPGEFTKRAFLNGRIDLSQAEAVIDIINSVSEPSRKNALSQLEGTLSGSINAVRERLVHLAAGMQVIIDYPDEDLEDVTLSDIENISSACLNDVNKLILTADSGRIIRNGIMTAIVGKPNVGKSSLLNALAMEDRSIVTDIAGTTRDVVEEYVNLGDVPLRLLDTAGIRETDDVVEKIGVEKSKRSIDLADLVIVVLDASSKPDESDREILRSTEGKKRLILLNKSDIGENDYSDYTKDEKIIKISAKTGEGLGALKAAIEDMYNLGRLSQSDTVIVTNMRHKSALLQAGQALERVIEAVRIGMPSDIASIDLNIAIDALGEITGATVSEDVVNEIFHSFCVGK
ncbi:MAG: tRNA uridine-5-carboxymethylaminomethyl(34) synthesis GTPase MnmE [Clostridia bacterium]|nr:tRNA uridine-5-carboxymethylaminomethyl(34) synthesis GTPase MnmE [Clostridia bacterium]